MPAQDTIPTATLSLDHQGQRKSRPLCVDDLCQQHLFKQLLSIPTQALITVLVLCNLLFFLPRQIQLHENYSGLPTGYHINLAQVYHPPFHNAVVVTSDYTVYQMVLFALNDPYLHGDVLYAWGSTRSDYTELQKAFPARKLYQMDIASDGSIEYTLIRATSLQSG